MELKHNKEPLWCIHTHLYVIKITLHEMFTHLLIKTSEHFCILSSDDEISVLVFSLFPSTSFFWHIITSCGH